MGLLYPPSYNLPKDTSSVITPIWSLPKISRFSDISFSLGFITLPRFPYGLEI